MLVRRDDQCRKWRNYKNQGRAGRGEDFGQVNEVLAAQYCAEI